MIPNLFINNKYFLIFVTILSLMLPALAEDTATPNALYKIELKNAENNTLFVKLHTTKKYSMLPSPIKKAGTGYVIFLPQTINRLEADISSIIVNTPVEDIHVEYFPSESDTGYTKIFIKTKYKGLNLSIENPLYIVKKSLEEIEKELESLENEEGAKDKTETKAPSDYENVNLNEITLKDDSSNLLEIIARHAQKDMEEQPENQLEEEAAEEKAAEEKFEEKKQEVIEEETIEEEPVAEQLPTEKPEPEIKIVEKTIEKIKIIEKEIPVKDYSLGILAALAILVFNLIYIGAKNKKKTGADGKLSDIIKKKTLNFAETDYLLLFSDNKEIINKMYDICWEESINLHIASANTAGLAEKFENNENINIKISEFKFDEFYKHKDFYKSLEPKPIGIVIDLSNRQLKNNTSKDAGFIDIKKYIDINYTNLYLMLSIALKDIDKNNGFIIFTETDKQISCPTQNKLNETFYKSTNLAVENLVDGLSNPGTGVKKLIFYCKE